MTSSPTNATRPSLLFFGRRDCDYTERLIALAGHAGFATVVVRSGGRGESLPDIAREWSGDLILSFRSLFILPAPVLEAASIAAINIHPGPVEYPGSGCVNWALYDDARLFGVTAHLMDVRVDSGTVLECRRFAIHQDDTVTSLLERTHAAAFELASDVIRGLARGAAQYVQGQAAAHAHERWTGRVRPISDIDQLQHIDPSIDRAELDRIVRATATPSFGPHLDLHGHRFQLTTEGTHEQR